MTYCRGNKSIKIGKHQNKSCKCQPNNYFGKKPDKEKRFVTLNDSEVFIPSKSNQRTKHPKENSFCRTTSLGV